MTRPLFQVGEEVLLVSKQLPHLNGEYTVEAVFEKGDFVMEALSEEGFLISYNAPHLGYWLVEDVRLEEGGQRPTWSQTALRKKHPPSEDSYEEMMTKLNEEVVEC